MKVKIEIDEHTMQAIREAFSKEWKTEHKGEFCEGQVPQLSDYVLIMRPINFYIGSFMNK